LLEGAAHADAEGVEDVTGTLDGDVVVLVALVARDLGLVHAEPCGELALREPEGDAQGDEGVRLQR
jgi:hypothetical protein